MSDLLARLQAAVVTTEIDLSELDEVYRDPETKEPLKILVRLNWTRGLKARQQELQEETLDLQRAYVRLKDLVGDGEAWQKAKADADSQSDENWEHWVEWWTNIFYVQDDAEARPMAPGEVRAMSDALPDNHWIWLTSRAGIAAADYEKETAKKAAAVPSPTSGARRNRPRKSGAKRG